ncbi:T9SS type A sorting domain-containing protein, partial [bacterium]|nr:T9SS type A sorting domain-containing protein [bacterium]
GLGNLTSIGNTLSIWNNHYLLNLTGLGNVTAIGGNIHIRDNSSLSGLVGLENVDATSIDSLFVYNNPSLSACEVQSICNYLAIPGGFTEIHDNATSCNSREEVAEACAYGLDENIIFNHFSIYPNPFSNLSTFEYELNEPAVVTLMIYNYLAQPTVNLVNENQQAAKHIITWNTEGLPSGIYFYRLQAGNRSASGKMIVVK